MLNENKAFKLIGKRITGINILCLRMSKLYIFLVSCYICLSLVGCKAVPDALIIGKKQENCLLSIKFIQFPIKNEEIYNFDEQQELNQLEVYFIRSAYPIGENKFGHLTETMKKINPEELAKYEVISHYKYDAIANLALQDVVTIEDNVQAILVVLTKDGNIINKKLLRIYPRKASMINIDLIGTEIKIKISN